MNHSLCDPATRTGCNVAESGILDVGNKAKLFTGDQARNDSRICEAVGCFEQATTTIEVKAGYQKTISLSLCKECVSKFRDEAQ
ncbi:MAG: hypothetical protein M3Y53_13110 [Thermoproteota archaeon]|nr:hypothetical protein [Thermoproteota archaeon]